MSVRSHILRALAGITLLFQIALPLVQANAVANGYNLASFICNPSGQSASVEAKIAMTELFAAIGASGQDEPPEDGPPDCERCVTPHAALSAHAGIITSSTAYDRITSIRPRAEILTSNCPRGPPCGTRAPPTFI